MRDFVSLQAADGQARWRLRAATALVALLAFSGCSVAEDTDAHALAQRFAAEPPAGAAPSPAAQPAANSQQASQLKRQAAEARQAEAQRKAAEARKAAAEAKRKADVAARTAAQARADEADMLARARAEREERLTAERAAAAAEQQRAAEAEAIAARQEAEAIVANRSAAEREAEAEQIVEAAKVADASRRQMEDERTAENDRLAERLRQAREARERRAAEAPRDQRPQTAELKPAPAPGSPVSPLVGEDQGGRNSRSIDSSGTVPVPPLSSPAGGVAAPPPSTVQPPRAEPARVVAPPETRVTVLVMLKPGDRGIRRFDKTADPVLCVGADCFVSAGPDQDAKRLERRRVLGTLNTLGRRAGACNHSLGCVFRNVDLGAERASLQPIDLKIMRHDRRETREAGADATCELLAGRLHCANAVISDSYRLWLVPESLARKAGPAALDTAVRDGLADTRRAEAR